MRGKRPTPPPQAPTVEDAHPFSLLSKMAATNESRRTFINSVIDFTRSRNFDGFDFDWEYPLAEDKLNFATLLKVYAPSNSNSRADAQVHCRKLEKPSTKKLIRRVNLASYSRPPSQPEVKKSIVAISLRLWLSKSRDLGSL